MKIAGKTVVVTGGASGIGRALVNKCKSEGAANLVIADIVEDELLEFAQQVGGTPVVCDVSDEEQVRHLVQSTEANCGSIDLICSNAGILIIGGVEASNDDWQRIWEVNVMSHVYMARHALPSMIKQGSGYFLITASAAGLLSQVGSAPYSVTKHAALSLAEWLLITHGAQGIKVSALCPQAVESKMTAPFQNGGVAGLDGVLAADVVADDVVAALEREQFLILPHPEAGKYFQHKASDYDRWIRGMQKLHKQFGESILQA